MWNRSAEKIIGHGAIDLPISDWSAHYGVYLPDQVTLCPTDLLPLVRAIHGESCEVELFVKNTKLPDGIWVQATAHPLIDETGTVRGGVLAFRDISRKRADETEIRRLNNELEQRVIQRTAELEAANRELESFSYSVSHDLRAPLRHIAGFSGILIEEFGPGLDPQARRYLQRIREGTQRMGMLVDELLNLARVGRHAMDFRETALKSLVDDIIPVLQSECQGRQVEWQIGELPIVNCDPGLIRQVFQNLLSNALKYSRTRPRAVIEVGHTQIKGQPAIFVRDNGVGFSMKYADKLFGVFQRLHRSDEFEGTGVGLATVQRIIQKHGGRIWAEAELDRGATFYFTLNGLEQRRCNSEKELVGA
jgi:light-regulated signal transduction histidine kinase (bacteriophytochrome)